MAWPKKDGTATANKYTWPNCLYQVLWVARRRTRTRCAAAKPAYPKGAASSTLGVPFIVFFFLIFLSISMAIFISPVNFILFVFKLIDWLFTFANLFQVVNFFSENFFLTAGDFNDCCLFQFYKQINLFCPLSLVCLFAIVVSKKKNLNPSLTKRSYLVKEQEITRRISLLPWQETWLPWLIWIDFSQLQNGNQHSR